ncbi:MAG: helix-turn-helix domain-containing protein [Mangrovibacterium sp.]
MNDCPVRLMLIFTGSMGKNLKDTKPAHLGNNIRRIREIIGIKQYVLAEGCGWSQQQMSKLENSGFIDREYLELIAGKLGVTSEFIKNFNEERAIYIIQHDITLNDNACNNGYQNINHPNDTFLAFFEEFIHNYENKIKSIEDISRVVLSLAEEVKKLKAAGK